MKTFKFNFCVFIGLLCFCVLTYAQTPQLINYQAVARNESGQPLVDQSVSVRLSVRQSSATGTVQYQETHNYHQCLGLINLQIGAGTVNIGSFTAIVYRRTAQIPTR
ncbi:MAG: hypothetical protein IPN94_22475 [Sphingobacteriales bacterium]|nr:hypothetical protein [Sphingobacteriales bacterium]